MYKAFFNKAKEVIIKDSMNESHEDPDKLSLKPGGIPEMEEIYDALEIVNRCCRMRLLTVCNYDELVK
jgi:hypothetical protein